MRPYPTLGLLWHIYIASWVLGTGLDARPLGLSGTVADMDLRTSAFYSNMPNKTRAELWTQQKPSRDLVKLKDYVVS